MKQQHVPEHVSSTGRRKKRPFLERIVILLLLLLAWSWIVAALMILYHSFYSSTSGSHIVEQSLHQGETPLLIFTCRRAEYLRQTLQDVLKYLPTDCSVGCPLIISQDGRDASVEKVIHEYQQLYPNIPILHYHHDPDRLLRRQPYKELAIHYKWALDNVFEQQASAHQIIILEEDLHIAPDFFHYFQRMIPLLQNDKTLLAVSAFNDNGLKGRVKDAKRVLRSDFFPGLGWMLTRQLWEKELSSKWPSGYWDDWLREPGQRKGRYILRPEVSRTFHFGTQGGASGNQFGDVLSSVELDHENVDWNSVQVDYLMDATEYNREYMNMVNRAIHSQTIKDALEQVKEHDVMVEYSSIRHFARLARQLHLMEDEKAGVPRTAYKGIVETRPNGDHFLFLVPKEG